MEEQQRSQCSHPGCGCRPESPFHPFCSAYCSNVVRDAKRENAQTDPAGACACGHPACSASLEEPRSDAIAETAEADTESRARGRMP